MDLTDLIVGGIVLVVLILIFAIGVDNTVPAFIRTEFDNICNRYISILSINGGLTNSDVNNLKAELEDLELKNISITATAPEEKNWGSKGFLEVTAYYEHESVNENFSKDINMKKLVYENSTVVYGLEN